METEKKYNNKEIKEGVSGRTIGSPDREGSQENRRFPAYDIIILVFGCDTIAKYREQFNQSVLDFNTTIQTFPNLLVAGLFGFEEEELFEAGNKAE